MTVTWRTLKDWKDHSRTFHGFNAGELASRFAWELGQLEYNRFISVKRA